MDREINADADEDADESCRQEVEMADGERDEAERPRDSNQQRGQYQGRLQAAEEQNQQDDVGGDAQGRGYAEVVYGGSRQVFGERGSPGQTSVHVGKSGARGINDLGNSVARVDRVALATGAANLHQQVASAGADEIAAIEGWALMDGHEAIPRQLRVHGRVASVHAFKRGNYGLETQLRSGLGSSVTRRAHRDHHAFRHHAAHPPINLMEETRQGWIGSVGVQEIA